MPKKKTTTTLQPPSDAKLGWHFLPSDMKLKYGDGRKAEVGKTLSCDPSDYIQVCRTGMHACGKAADAAQYCVGPVLTRVKVWGDVSSDSTKFAGRHRHVLWAKALTIDDIKKCCKDTGFDTKGYGYRSLPDWVGALGSASAKNPSAVDKWLANWAVANGLNDGATQAQKVVHLVYEKQPLTEKAVKQFLSERMVRTTTEIRKDMEKIWECDGGPNGDVDTLEDFLDALWGLDICKVESFGKDDEDGYVLKQKRKR